MIKENEMQNLYFKMQSINLVQSIIFHGWLVCLFSLKCLYLNKRSNDYHR